MDRINMDQSNKRRNLNERIDRCFSSSNDQSLPSVDRCPRQVRHRSQFVVYIDGYDSSRNEEEDGETGKKKKHRIQ